MLKRLYQIRLISARNKTAVVEKVEHLITQNNEEKEIQRKKGSKQ